MPAQSRTQRTAATASSCGTGYVTPPAEPVVDADHHGTGPVADLAGHPVRLGHVEVAHPERAAVQPDQAGSSGAVAAARAVDAHRDRPVRTRGRVVPDVDAGGAGASPWDMNSSSRGRRTRVGQPCSNEEMPSSRGNVDATAGWMGIWLQE